MPNPDDAALEEFRRAWLEGKRPDPDEFCSAHPDCGPELADRIGDFVYVAEGLEEMADSRKERDDDRPADGQEDLAGMTLGDFKIIAMIGRGGMGTVFEAEQISLRRPVALKVLPSHLSLSDLSVQKFHREAEAGGRQSHPGVVAVHAVGEFEGRHFIAQELVPGGATIADRIKEVAQRDAQPSGHYREVAGLFVAIADALDHAHRAGVIHRDVKPSNILLDGEGRPKVTDFGLAKVEDALELSRSGEFAGTPYYMSPEQAMRRRQKIDSRTDIYSLGVTLYEMLTLKRPFEGVTSHDVLKQILVGAPQDPRKLDRRVPRDLAVICLKAMEKEPEKRYQRMSEMAADLGRYMTGDVIEARPASSSVKLWKLIQRHPVVSVAASVVLLAVISFTAFQLFVSLPQIRAEKEKAETLLERLLRYADSMVLGNLGSEAEVLWPRRPHMIEKLEIWRNRAEYLVSRLPKHLLDSTKLLSEIEQQGKSSPRESDLQDILLMAPAISQLGGIPLEWEYKTLSAMIKGIHDLQSEDGLLKSIEKRITIASEIKEKTIDQFRAEWDFAISSIGDKTECPKYDGLIIKPQIGLVPLGRDPQSGLWEFGSFETGSLPLRASNGILEITEETGLVFVLIPGGTFNMGSRLPSADHPLGSPNVDPEAVDHESPVLAVTVPPFLLSKYEMTQSQWTRHTEVNPSMFSPDRHSEGPPYSGLHPVECVSWVDCETVLFQLGLRIPTESEWEYAARGGTSTIWWTGNDRSSLAGAANVCDLAWFKIRKQHDWPYDDWLDDGYGCHAPVGSFRPNNFGLHDIHGNVLEWCRDSYYASHARTPSDGSAYESSGTTPVETTRVYRGGGWDNYARDCRSAYRDYGIPEERHPRLGIRPAASLQ